MILCIIKDKEGNTKAEYRGEQINVIYGKSYEPGDKAEVSFDSDFVKVTFDESQKESLVYVPERKLVYELPYGDKLLAYDKASWNKDSHRITITEIQEEEAYGTRELALNSLDTTDNTCMYPHATASFVTRGEPIFQARNAIDGVIENHLHGEYPHHSWSAGAKMDMDFVLDFGMTVNVEKIIFFLRADFPHDTYWNSLNVIFDDDTKVKVHFEKTAEGQVLELAEAKNTRTIKLCDFTQPETPPSFAALTQIQVIGNYIKEERKNMEVRSASNPKDVKHYTTDRLREEFHIAGLFSKDNFKMVYSHIDRIITAGFMPVDQVLKLEAGKELAAEYFLQRREMGCINIGGKGIVTVDDTEYVMNPRDGIYIGMGNKEITFKSVDPQEPAKFYVSSCPAHQTYPTVHIDITKAKKVPCGSVEECNKRVINQYIHPEVMKSCQLAMGLTQLEVGSNWNTMPCHTHDRRMEVYLYLDMEENDAVFHMMGEPKETRHIIMHNEEAVISPSWSIHSGVGTRNYSFIWAMCGENQEFTDMDFIETKELR